MLPKLALFQQLANAVHVPVTAPGAPKKPAPQLAVKCCVATPAFAPQNLFRQNVCGFGAEKGICTRLSATAFCRPVAMCSR
jgi:hypothetical protein